MKKFLILLFAFGALCVSFVNVGATPTEKLEVVDDVGIDLNTNLDVQNFDVMPVIDLAKAEIPERQTIPIPQSYIYSARHIKRKGKSNGVKTKSPPINSNIKAVLKTHNLS